MISNVGFLTSVYGLAQTFYIPYIVTHEIVILSNYSLPNFTLFNCFLFSSSSLSVGSQVENRQSSAPVSLKIKIKIMG